MRNRVLVASGTGTVSTTTVLCPWRDFGRRAEVVLVCFRTDGICTVTLDTSEFGTYADADKSQVLVTAAAGEGSFEIGPNQMRTNFMLSAFSADPAFPNQVVDWKVYVVER